MKNQLIFIAIITLSLSVKAQIYTPGGTIQGTSPNDNVGIGTSAATSKLTVQAGPNGHPTPLKAISIVGPNTPTNVNSAQALSWDFKAAGSAAIRSYRGNSWDTYMQFLTNSNVSAANAPQVRMHISGDGNIGIGTENPMFKLDINGDAKIKQSLFISGSSGGYTTGDNPVLYFGINSEFAKINLPFGDKMNFSSYHGYTFNTSNNGSIAIPALTIGITGNVGIGTIAPDEKLTVKGKIHTQEVRVDMSGPLVPDYVFANDYQLKSLQEVEAYIKQNSHLPEIPSAKEIEKKGLMLAEMNMALLKKIEELTLYAIEQEKNTAKLIHLLEEQNKRLKILEENRN